MSKKKKYKKTSPVSVQSPAAVQRLAEDHLRLGRLDEVIRLLARHVEGQPAPDPTLRQMLAQAHYRRALQSTNPSPTDLERAVKYGGEQPRYRLAVAVASLARGRTEEINRWVESTGEPVSSDPLCHIGRAIGLLAAQQTREFKELTRQLPEALAADSALARLGVLRHLLVGNAPLAEPLLGALDSLDRNLYEGIARWLCGDEAAAVESLTALPLLESNPTAEEAQTLATQSFLLGVLQARAGRVAAALAAWREGQRLALEHRMELPWVKRLPAHWQGLAAAALAEQDLETARACLEQALALDSENKALRANLRVLCLTEANRLSQQGQLERAVELWRACVTSGSQNEVVLRNLAVACEKLERIEEAAQYWRQLARLWRSQVKDARVDPSLKDRLARLERHAADLMLKSGRPPHEVIAELEAALKTDPGQHELRRVLADVLLDIGQPQKAVRHLEMIHKQQGATAQLLAQIGAAHEMAGRNGEARRSYERAIELDPAYVPARRMLVQLMGDRASYAAQNGDYAQAMEICRQQLAIDPTYVPALSHLAMLCFHCGQKRQTELLLQRILDLDPTDPSKHGIVGGLYLAMRETKKAKAEFDKAIELDPSAMSFYNVGVNYLNVADLKKALAYFDRAVACGSVETTLDIAGALHDGGYIREAHNYVNKALAQDPTRPDAYLLRADLLLHDMNLKSAKEALNQAEAFATGSKHGALRAEIRSMKADIRDVEDLDRVIGMSDLRDLPPMPSDLMRLFRKLGKGL
jgi:tetratricopeptide (TPR) repeat protein